MGAAVIDGHKVAVDTIAGVLTRIPCVYEHELGHIMPADRAYVASEMTAFLFAWLSGLSCPVLNRPTANCLGGPNWRRERWVRLATSLGIPALPVQRKVSQISDGLVEQPSCEVIVVGDRCFGNAAPALTSHARALAKAADVDFLAVQFNSPDAEGQFVSASLWPHLVCPEVADAVLCHLLGRAAC
jgi:hypothetical protein